MAGTPTPPMAAADTSIVRLHGEACWHCGAVAAGLAPIGQVTTIVPGGRRVWPVVGCPQHLEAPEGRRASAASTPVTAVTEHVDGRVDRHPVYAVHAPGEMPPAEVTYRCIGRCCVPAEAAS